MVLVAITMTVVTDAEARRLVLVERTAQRIFGALVGNDPRDGEMTLYLSVQVLRDRPGYFRYGLVYEGELMATVTVATAK
jgi:hypothetical protein